MRYPHEKWGVPQIVRRRRQEATQKLSMSNQVTHLWQNPSLTPKKKKSLLSKPAIGKKHRYLRHGSGRAFSEMVHLQPIFMGNLLHLNTPGNKERAAPWASLFPQIWCAFDCSITYLHSSVVWLIHFEGYQQFTLEHSLGTKTLYFRHQRSHFGLGARGQASRPQEQTQQQFSRSQISGKHGKEDEAENYFCGCLTDIKSHKA